MKKIFLLALGVLTLGSCSQDENFETVQVSADLSTPLTDLKTMTPNVDLDISERGTYSGVITADNTKFHGKLYLNIGNNDARYSAMVETIKGERLYFELKAQKGSTYSFAGQRGSFDVDISDTSLVNTTNITIDNTQGAARVRKETNGRKNAIVLGTFDDNSVLNIVDPQSFTGVWDIMGDPTTGFITEVIYQFTDDPIMKSDFAVDFELGSLGCAGTPDSEYYPQYNDDPTDFRIFATEQVMVNANRILYYDLTFFQGFLDFNSITDYTTGGPVWPTFYPTFTCTTFTSHGQYAVLTPDGVSVVAGGSITFDTSGLTPPPSPLTKNQTSKTGLQLEANKVRPNLSDFKLNGF